MAVPSVFEERCKRDPQGVIKDLLDQVSRQAKAIHKHIEKNKLLDKEISILWLTVEKTVSKKDLQLIQDKLKCPR